jgi:hypothetical protein
MDIHVIELLCYNWRFANFWLEIWSHNWRFFIDVFDACFYCLLMFSFCLFQYWTNCIPFQYILFTFVLLVVFHIMNEGQDGIDKPQKCRNVCYHPMHQQQSDFLILVLYEFIVQNILSSLLLLCYNFMIMNKL